MSRRALRTYLPALADAGRRAGYVCAIVDPDEEKAQEHAKSLQPVAPPVFPPDRLEDMLAQCRPDVVLVTGPDATHTQYVRRALAHDIDVIVEKPMAASCADCVAIMQAEQRSLARVTVTMNLRYDPGHQLIQRLLRDGHVGRVTNVEFSYNLDTTHGPSYFVRWHRDREVSGGLSVTKSCHHFDLLNWWLEDSPEQVFAYGALNYFGSSWPAGVDHHIHGPGLSDHSIAIEDTYSAVIRYRRGASVAYSINFSSAWEGLVLGINGTRGRIETTQYVAPDRCGFAVPRCQTVRYLPLNGEAQIFEIPLDDLHHATADRRMLGEIYGGPTRDTAALGTHANSTAGANAVAVGEAMWRSVEGNMPVNIDQLLATAGDHDVSAIPA